MTGRGTATVTARLGSMGDQSALSAEQFCGADTCEGPRVTTLDNESLCCDHFLARCYGLLEQMDRGRELTNGLTGGESSKRLRERVEECSGKVLQVALGTAGLDNLQRARLLDILLWSSDLLAGGNSREGSPFGLTTIDTQSDDRRLASKKQPKPRGWRTTISY
jgi:hypothetical protein